MNPLRNLSYGLRSLATSLTMIILAGPILAQELTVSSDTDPDLQSGASWILDPIDLEATPSDTTVSHVTLKNDGADNLNLGTITLSASDHFSLATNLEGNIIAAGQERTLSIRFSPQSYGTHQAVVTIFSNDSDESPFTLNLSGTAHAPQLGLEQPSGNLLSQGDEITFPDTPINTTNPLNFIIGETGDRALDWQASIGGTDHSSFQITTTPPSGTIVEGGAAASLTVEFTPSSSGPKTATLSIASNDPAQNPFNITLRGTAQSLPEISITLDGSQVTSGATEPLDFGDVDLNSGTSSHSELTFKVSNSGDLNLNLSSDTFTPGAGTPAGTFTVSSTYAGSVTPSGETTFTIRFDPSSRGIATAVFELANNDGNGDESPFRINLQGRGVGPVIQVDQPAGQEQGDGDTVDFLAVVVGATETLRFTIREDGELDLTWSAAISGGTEFQIDSNLPGQGTISDGGSPQQFDVNFTPTASGARSDTLIITNNDATASRKQYTISLTGSGQTPQEIQVTQDGSNLTSGGAPIDFGSVDMNGTQPYEDRDFVVRNNGGVNLVLQALEIIPDPNSSIFDDFIVQAQPANTTIAPGAHETFTVRFQPQETDERIATLSLSSNDSASPFLIPLTGQGVAPYVYVRGEDGAIVSTRSAAIFPFTPADSESELSFVINNVGTATLENLQISLESGTADYTLSNLPAATTINADGDASFTVIFNPQPPSKRNLEGLVRVSGSNLPPYEFTVTGDSLPTPPGIPDNFGYVFQSDLPASATLLSGSDPEVIEATISTNSTQALNIGFAFSFYENTYSTCGISSKGLVTFGGDSGVYSVPARIPTQGSTPNNFVAPFWSNLVGDGSSSLLYTTRGSDGGRVFILQYTDFKQGSGTGRVTFQVHLLEGSNNIEFHYMSNTILSETSDTVSVGIQNSTGTAGLGYWFGQQDGTAETPFLDAGFVTFPSVIRFSRPVRSRVVSAFSGKPNNGTRITCDSTVGLEVGMYVVDADANSADQAEYLLPRADGRPPFIEEIIGPQTFVISHAVAKNGTGLRFTASTKNPWDATDTGEEIISTAEIYEENFDSFPDGSTDLGDFAVLAGNRPQVKGGRLYLTFDKSAPEFSGTGGRTSFSIPSLSGSSTGWEAQFDYTLYASSGQNPADGFSFNYGNAPLGARGWEEGMQGTAGVTQNLSFEVDTWHQGSTELGTNIAGVVDGQAREYRHHNGNVINPGETRSGTVRVEWDPDNGATFQTTGLRTGANWSNIPVDGFYGNNSYGFNISARIGGANQTFSIDNLRIETVGTQTVIDPTRTISLTNCVADLDASPFMLSSVGTSALNLGFNPAPGGTYSSLYGADKGFAAPPFIYLNDRFEPLTAPGAVPSEINPSNIPDELAVYRLVNDGYSVGGQFVQGANTFVSAALTEDVTVLWRWRLEYAVFVEAASERPTVKDIPQDGVGNPVPSIGRHWVARNTELTLSIDRVSGDDFLNSDIGGFRYGTVAFVEKSAPEVGQPHVSSRTENLGDTGNRLTANTSNPVREWSILQWRMMPQVRYRFNAISPDATTEAANFQGQSFVRTTVWWGDPTNGGIPGNPTYNNFSPTDTWIDVGDTVDVGAFYRTEDRCFTIGNFPGPQGGNLSALSTNVSDLEDRDFVDSNGTTRVARVYTVQFASKPTTFEFNYLPTVFRAEIPLGEFLDALNPDERLVPQICSGAVLRNGEQGPEPGFEPRGPTPPGNKHAGESVIWDRVGKRLLPLHPGSYRIKWPDANDPSKVYDIEIVSHYPGDSITLTSEREQLLPNGNSKRETGTSPTLLPVFDSSGAAVMFPPTRPFPDEDAVAVPDPPEALYFVTSTTMDRVDETFPGSLPKPFLDAHYRHLYDDNNFPNRQPPSRLDLISTDHWKFKQMSYSDAATNPTIGTATEGTAFTPNAEGRCVLVYSVRPNPNEVATGNLTQENIEVRVVRCEKKASVLADNPKLVLGRRGLKLRDRKMASQSMNASELALITDQQMTGTGPDIPLGNSFVVDFWLKGSGLRPDDGDVTIFGTGGDLLKVTLSSNLSETTVILENETQLIDIPFEFSSSGELVVTNVSTGETLSETTDYQVTSGSPSGAPNGTLNVADTPASSIGDQIRVQLETSRDPGARITASYHGVEVTHPFSTTGMAWRHYIIHVFPSSFFGTELTVVDFYKDGIKQEQAVVTNPANSTLRIDPAATGVDALRFGVGADPRSDLAIDQFRVFSGLRSTRTLTPSSTDPWLTTDETNSLRTEQTTALRERSPQIAFDFESSHFQRGSGRTAACFTSSGTTTTVEIETPLDASGQYLSTWAHNDIQEVATRLTSTLDNAGFSGRGYILNETSNYNAAIYNRTAQVGYWGPIYPVTDGTKGNLYNQTLKRLEIAYYENPYRIDPLTHPNVAWPYEVAAYDEVTYPTYGPHTNKRIYIASRLGSEGVDKKGKPQEVFNLDRYANFKIYNQPSKVEAGYNPNEEHAIAAGSNRAALKIKNTGEDIPNNPPLAAFALQKDINVTTSGTGYTSDPWVLVQVDNLVTGEPEMAAYKVGKTRIGTIHFPRPSDTLVNSTAGLDYESAENPEDRFLVMDPKETYNFSYAFSYPVAAGDLLIPPYPLNLVIGNTPTPDARGGNDSTQRTVWRDVNGTAWVVSGDGTFFYQYFYPFRGDFYLPNTPLATPVAWVPDLKNGTRTFTGNGSALEPGKVVYQSFWRSGYPKLKRGESLTYQGGEYFNENPGSNGLPALVAMNAAEIVFDAATPTMIIGDDDLDEFTARIIRPLDRHEARFTVAQMAGAGFTPASDKVFIVGERWYFTELPGSLQKRFYYDSLAEKLVFRGYLNDKESGDPDLTAGPDPLNILEPNVITADDLARMLPLGTGPPWTDAVNAIHQKSQNPNLIRDETPPLNPAVRDVYLAGMKESPVVTERIGLNRSLFSENANLTAESARIASLSTELETLESRWDVQVANWFSIDSGQAALRSDIAAGAVNTTQISERISSLGYDIELLPTQDQSRYAHLDSFGVGSALVANPNLLTAPVNGSHYITIVENNRSELDGAPISLHIIEIIPDRYRGALKVIEAADAFSEKVTIQHSGDFGANTENLYYEWWIRDAGPLDVVAGEIRADATLKESDPATGQSLWQQYLPEPKTPKTPAELAALNVTAEEAKHLGLHTIVFEGRPDITLADKMVLMRYRHKDEKRDWNLVPFDYTDGATEWAPAPLTGAVTKAPFQWAGAANSPQLQADGSKRYIPQLVMGWVKRVLDRINPYEARYTDFLGNESPAVYSSQIQIAGAPYAGRVALNSDKDVIENTGLIELYETVLARAKELSIDNSSNPVSTDGINQAILLAATRLAVLYELLAREAYSDAQDSTITVSSEEWGLDQVAPYTHVFQNMEASLQHEELALLRGTDFRKSYPVFNRMFWNYAKGLGEAAYNLNYNIQDTNMDGFINEDDARALFPQGHGDSWGHFLSALGMHYELLQQPVFQWNSRPELYALMENVLEVDYLDEKTFAKLAAGKALAGRDIVRGTYRLHYTQDPDGQWQGYSDESNPARGWGVSEWGHRTGQAAYFDWAIANAILPEDAENATPVENPENLDLLERSIATDEIGLIAEGLFEIQLAMDEANGGVNPLGFDSDTLALDLNVEFYENASGGDRRSHFEQIHTRAVTAANNALATMAQATGAAQKLRNRADDTDALMVAAFEQDLDYRNSLIEIFGRPYDGQIGVGKPYPEGYLGPDVLLYAYLDRTTITEIIPTDTSSPGTDPPWTTVNIQFDDIKARIQNVANDGRITARYAVGGNSAMLTESIAAFVTGRNYQSPLSLHLPLPVRRTSAYAFQATGWGERLSYGLLQNTLQEMLAEEIALQAAVNEYLGFLGDLDAVVTQLYNKIERLKDIGGLGDSIQATRATMNTLILVQKSAKIIADSLTDVSTETTKSFAEAFPRTIGFSNDVTSGGRAITRIVGVVQKVIGALSGAYAEIGSLILELSRDEIIAALERDVGRIESIDDIEGLLVEFENQSGNDAPMRNNIGGHLQRLEILSQEYKTHLNTGFSLLRKRAAFNKVLAASVQKNRYQDMILRLTRNEIMGKYQSAFNHAARYTWLAAQAYDYETSLDPGDPAAAGTLLDRIVKERQLGLWVDGEPQVGQGGLAEILANLRDNFGVLKGQLGIDAPQSATEKMSLRSELFRIGPGPIFDESGTVISGSAASDERWENSLKDRIVNDVTALPEFARYCRPFSSPADGAQPGLVIRFSSHVEPGLNFFGRPLGPGDHSYSTANFATKIRGMGIWMENYNSTGLSTTPRAYLVPAGNDYLRTSSSGGPSIRMWNIEERRIPTPFVTNSANLTSPGFIPSLDGVDGSFGELRRHGDFRIYHDDGDAEADDSEIEYDSRLIGRSVWNSDWLLIIPGAGLHANPLEGLDLLTEGISDIKLHFTTYSHQGQ